MQLLGAWNDDWGPVNVMLPRRSSYSAGCSGGMSKPHIISDIRLVASRENYAGSGWRGRHRPAARASRLKLMNAETQDEMKHSLSLYLWVAWITFAVRAYEKKKTNDGGAGAGSSIHPGFGRRRR